MDTTQGVLNLYKKKGETPLERIERFRIENSEFIGVKMTYAGRLDPLAEGVLLVIYGDEIKKKNEYLKLDKEYTFEMIFGFETDTYDLLGKIVAIKTKALDIKREEIKEELKKFIGKKSQTYPPFSSKTVKGRALFDWAKEDKLSEIEIPKRDVDIYDLKLLNIKTITDSQLEKMVFNSIKIVKGDFRQKEIGNIWTSFFDKSKQKKFVTAKLLISCGSGTYVRSVVYSLGRELQSGATALSITRTNVGIYRISNALR